MLIAFVPAGASGTAQSEEQPEVVPGVPDESALK
jgi:hypothetical protein